MKAAPNAPAPAPPASEGWEVLQATRPGQEAGGVDVAELHASRGNDLSAAGQKVGQEVVETIETVSGRELHWPDRADLLHYCREADSILAAVLLFAGLAYSAFGYTLFKLAVTLNVAGLGVWAGFLVGREFDARIPGMIVGGFLFAALAWPTMRVAVALCAGLVGFVVGVAVWRALGMADAYAPAGGLIGMIFLFMLSFSLLKLSILAFTAIQGAVMIVGGLLGLVLKYPSVDEAVVRWTTEQPALLPIVLLALSIVGLLFQQTWHRPKPAEA